MQLHQNIEAALHALHTAEVAAVSIKKVLVNLFCIACYVSYKSGKLYRQTLDHHLNIWAEEAYGEGVTIPEAVFMEAERLGYTAVRSAKKVAIAAATTTEKWDVASRVEGGAVALANLAQRARFILGNATWFVIGGIAVYHRPGETRLQELTD